MRKYVLLIAIAAATLFPSAASANAPTESQDDTRSIDQYTATYDIHEDGSVDVAIDLLFNFGDAPGHGWYVRYPLSPDGGPGGRTVRYTNVSASSPSGAPALVDGHAADGQWEIRIGDPAIGDVSGVQEYTLTYTMDGVLEPMLAAQPDAGDAAGGTEKVLYEAFRWAVLGGDWTLPINDITIVVRGGVSPLDLRCYASATVSVAECSSAVIDGDGATFTQDHLDPYTGMSVAVAYPPGSFDTASTPASPVPSLTPEPSASPTPSATPTPTATVVAESDGFHPSGWLVAVAAVVVALAAIAVVVVIVTGAGTRRRRD